MKHAVSARKTPRKLFSEIRAASAYTAYSSGPFWSYRSRYGVSPWFIPRPTVKKQFTSTQSFIGYSGEFLEQISRMLTEIRPARAIRPGIPACSFLIFFTDAFSPVIGLPSAIPGPPGRFR